VPRGVPNPKPVYVCRESFAGEFDGAPISAHKGVTRVAAGHPLLDTYGAYFEPVGQDVHFAMPEVEQATAAPGEKRGAPAATKPAENAGA
jgi:hypothetical protein